MVFNGGMSEFRYKAFISYSHRDKAWAGWLQRSLERYRVPKRMVGEQGEFGPVPSRLAPVFRDREDFSSAADLSAQVKQALQASESLIVICSPAAAASRWVNEEVAYFASLGRRKRIFPLIVDGDPQAADPAERCFPPALVVNDSGEDIEPLAADARKWADGKLLAKLKIISAVLGVRLDDLRRRDMQRRHRVWMASTAGALSIALLTTVLAVLAITARQAAENRREHAESLVGYMVGDLRAKLGEVGRLDILEGMGGQVSDYLKTLDPAEVTDESLAQQARVWRQLGEVSMDQGELPEALTAFSNSRDILAELRRRNPENAEFLFELGNAEFWVGYVHVETGEFEKAGAAFSAYLRKAYELNELEPDNAAWLMETSYAHSNLAALANRRRAEDVGQALEHIESAVAIIERVIELAPEEPAYFSEYGEALAWLADTQLLACKLGDAVVSRQKNVAIAEQEMDRAPGNVNLKQRYAYALTGLSRVAQNVGLFDMALENYQRAREILMQLSVMDPSNLDFRFEYLAREFYIAELRSETGRLEQALEQMQMVHEPFKKLLADEKYENLRHTLTWIYFLTTYSDMQWRSGATAQADALIAEAVRVLQDLLARKSDPAIVSAQFMSTRFTYWQHKGADLAERPEFEMMGAEMRRKDSSCSAQKDLVEQAIMVGDMDKAREITTRLLGKGYYGPRFIRICKQYGLCGSDQ